jgi:SEC-C motif domain protein
MSKKTTPPAEACPCESGKPYEVCCGMYHRGAVAPTPEALMRSRYSAYTMRLSLYLLMTWHPSTRPHFQDLEVGGRDTVWLGLKVLRAEQPVPDEGTVEFVARYRVGGGRAVRLHETSRFVRERGVWFYVDGEVKAP